MTSSRAPVPALRWLRVRLYVTALFLTGLFGAISWRAYSLQIRDGAKMRAIGESQYRKELVIPAPRGSIRDRNGVELAVSVDGESVEGHPREVVDVAGTAAKLAGVMDLDVRELEEKLGSGRRYVWIQRRVTPEQAKRVRDLDLPGVQVVGEPRRFYPGRSLAAPILGTADLDGKGLEGIELTFDEQLRGQRSRTAAVRDARGDMVLTSGWDAPPPDAAGASVTLTIDRVIQFSAERALATAVHENKAKAGVVVVLDPRTSEVLAMASYPTYDPNEGRAKDVRNRATSDAYELGSIMKVFTLAAAVDAGVVRPSDTFDVEGGRLQVGRKLITDTHKGEHVITVGEIMKFSSNVGAVKIVRKLGKERFAQALATFGFGRETGIELPGERSGVVRDPSKWGEIGLATAAYGYGITVTPLQIAAGVAAIANGGVWNAPSLVKRVLAPGGQVVSEHTPVSRRVVSQETATEIKDMMKLVMEKGGTAANVTVPGFVLAGKTGTAHKYDPRTGRSANDKYMSSFVGFAPADDPRLLILVVIDEPGGDKHFGGSVAGPVFATIAEEGLKYLGVPAAAPAAPAGAGAGAGAESDLETETEAEAEGEAEAAPDLVGLDPDVTDVPPAGPGEEIVVIPDFSGMSVGQAVSAAAAAGVKVEIEGSGRAKTQFPTPGRALKSITCRVTFDPL